MRVVMMNDDKKVTVTISHLTNILKNALYYGQHGWKRSFDRSVDYEKYIKNKLYHIVYKSKEEGDDSE